MYKATTILYILTLIFFSSCRKNEISERQAQAFIKFIGGNKKDIGYDLKQTEDGGYIVIGTTINDTADIVSENIIVIKTNKYGNKEWINEFGEEKNEEGKCVQIIPGEGYLLFGTKTLPATPHNYQIEDKDFYFIIIDNNGDKIFEKTLGDSLHIEIGSYAAVTDEGNFIFVGSKDEIESGNQPTNTEDQDICYMSTDKNGKLIETWGEPIYNTDAEGKNDYANFITKYDNDHYLIIGNTYSNATYSGTKGGSNIFAYLILKENGAIISSNIFGYNSDDFGRSAIVMPDKTIYIFGAITDTNKAGDLNLDFYLIKTTNLEEEPLLDTTYGYEHDEDGYGITVSGNRIGLVGSSQSAGHTNGSKDIYLKIIDFNGDSIADNNFGYTDVEIGHKIIGTSDGGFAIIGETYSENVDNKDINFIKTDENGELKFE